MASPHVAGLAELMRSQNPTYNVEFVKENLLLAHRPLSAFSGSTKTITQGIANADHAIKAFGDSFD